MSSEYNGNILYVKDENGEWIPIPSIVGPEGKDGQPGPQGPEGPQGPQGPAGTYTAGTGIDITNGVISCTLVDANSEAY